VSHEDLDAVVGSNATVEITCMDTVSHAICDNADNSSTWTDAVSGAGDTRPVSGVAMTQQDAVALIIVVASVGTLFLFTGGYHQAVTLVT
jgi:hypothetical protein